MPNIEDALQVNLEGYAPIEPVKPLRSAPIRNLEPSFDAMMRCPLPPVSVTPDSLRQYYIGSRVPQTRLITPPNSVIGSSGGGGVSTTTIISQSSGSSSKLSLPRSQASITTPTLNQGNVFTGIISLAKSFQLLTVSANNPCRVQLYGTQSAQVADFGRGVDVAPPAGMFQNIISDVVLDSSPFQWPYQNRIGANGDSPQTQVIYISVTNLDSTSEVFTVTVVYVPLET